MGEHHWKGKVRYVKADAYGVPDLIREYRISFAVACLCRTLCEQCGYRDLVYIGTTNELHELTGLGRKTIAKYLDELCDRELIIRLPTPVGSTQTYFDVSNAYAKLIVPNEETPRSRAKKAAKEQQLESDSALDASSTRQMTHSTRGNTGFGGSEVIEAMEEVRSEAEGELRQKGVSGSDGVYVPRSEWPHEVGALFEAISEQWPGAHRQLTSLLNEFRFEARGEWAVAAERLGVADDIRRGLYAIVEDWSQFDPT